MTVVDANILLYAYNADAPQQATAAQWLKQLFASKEMIGLPRMTIWAFLRICTNTRIWEKARPAGEVFGIIRDWLAHHSVVVLEPGPRHWEILQMLVLKYGATGPLVADATLAALAMENGASLASTDQDFSRFEGLRWINPLRPQPDWSGS